MPTDNALHKAAHNGDLEECKMYLQGNPDAEIEPIDINEPGAADRRALHRSAGAGHVEVTRYFIDSGAKINLADKNGRTALHWAAISGHTELVKLLIEKGANLDVKTTSGMNVLQCACEANKPDIVKLIMDTVINNLDMKMTLTMNKNDQEKTAWAIANGAKNSTIIQILKDGGDQNSKSSVCSIC